MKTCLKCKVEKPLDAFYLKEGKPRPYCKPCYKEMAKQAWLRKKDLLFDWKRRLEAVGVRVCTKCKEAKPFGEFSPRNNRGDLSPWCRPCYNAYYAERRASDPAVRAREKVSREKWNAKHPEKIKEWNDKNWPQRKDRDSYYAFLIAANDFPRELVTKEMIDFKRAQMKLQRLLKERRK